MKLSKFAVVVHECPDKDSCIVFSTLTRAIVQLPTRLYKSIMSKENIIENSRDIEILKSKGIVVDDDIDEDIVYKFWSNRIRYGTSELAITPVMTYGCNCVCKYCYEEGVRQGPDGLCLTQGMCEKLIDWVKRYIILRESNLLDVCFHGGEPLLKINELEFLGLNLKNFCEERGMKYSFGVVTNGTLLTTQTVEMLLNAGVEHVLITLDGPKQIHNERRRFIGGEGTFDIIIKNIIQAVDELKISININIDKHNCESAYELANTLTEKGLQKKLHNVHVSLVEPSKVPLWHCVTYDLLPHEYWRYNIMIYRTFLKKGFKIGNLMDIGFCSLSRDDQFIIDPQGNFYKCVTGIGDENFKVGDIDDDLNILAIKTSQFIENPRYSRKECMDCPYRPICRGGCAHESYVRYDDINKVCCMREYYKNFIPNVIKEFWGKQLLLQEVG